MLAVGSRDAHTLSSSRFSVKSSNFSGTPPNRSPCTGSVSLFMILCLVSVESRKWFPSTGLRARRRRMVAGLDVQSSAESCGSDVGDVFAVELEDPVDNPETTIGT